MNNIDRSTIRILWSITTHPNMDALKTEGRLVEAQPEITATALASLSRIYPSGDAPGIDFCHALELAAENWRKVNA